MAKVGSARMKAEPITTAMPSTSGRRPAVGHDAAGEIADRQGRQHGRDQRRPGINAAAEIGIEIARAEHFEAHHDRAGDERPDVENAPERRRTRSPPCCSGRGRVTEPSIRGTFRYLAASWSFRGDATGSGAKASSAAGAVPGPIFPSRIIEVQRNRREARDQAIVQRSRVIPLLAPKPFFRGDRPVASFGRASGANPQSSTAA